VVHFISELVTEALIRKCQPLKVRNMFILLVRSVNISQHIPEIMVSYAVPCDCATPTFVPFSVASTAITDIDAIIAKKYAIFLMGDDAVIEPRSLKPSWNPSSGSSSEFGIAW
jgi:hypothetical protein